MRAIRWSLALILSLSLLSPPVSLAQGRGHGDNGKAKVEKVDKQQGKAKANKKDKDKKKDQRGKGNRGRSAKAGDKKARAHAERVRVRPHDERSRQERLAERRQRAPARTTRQVRRDDRRDQTISARVIEELRREDARARDRHPDRLADRRHRAPDGHRTMRFRGLDRNDDGRIGRREWRGNDVSFRNHDWNGDGILAGAEVIPGGRRDRVRRPSPIEVFRDRDHDRVRRVVRQRPILRVREVDLGRRLVLPPAPLVTRLDRALAVNQRLWADPTVAPRYYARDRDDMVLVDFGLDLDDQFDLFTLPLTLLLTEALVDDVDVVVRTERWADFDRDFDGYVTPVEWSAGDGAFHRLDRDHDLVLVRDELFVDDTYVAIDRERFLLFDALDRDEDGLVAPWEWPGDLDSFFFRDLNADGAVALDEFLGLETQVEVRELGFDALDFDRSGQIARVEWVGDPVRFARLDRNDNGVVGRWEFGVGWLFGA